MRRHFLANGALPATLFYKGYSKSSCTSLNHVVCHGIPNDKPLKDGDILNIDVTCILNGWHGDTSRMFTVGEVRRKAERLIEVTYEALMRGIAEVKPGNTFGDIGAAIQNTPKASAAAWCAISAGTASASSSMMRRTCCISVTAAPGP